MSNPCLEAVTSELDKADIPYRVEQGGKHTHIRFGNDYEHLHVVASTPSDHRAPLNERAQIRRDLVALGLAGGEAEAPDHALVTLTAGKASCFSYSIAEAFSKAHKDVLRAIDKIREECGPEFDRRNFTPIDYIDPKGRKYRAYRLTRDGFSLVVMGFTGSSAMEWKVKYIDAFNAMETEILNLERPSDMAAIRMEMDAVVSLIAEIESKQQSVVTQRRVPVIPASVIARRQVRRRAFREARS